MVHRIFLIVFLLLALTNCSKPDVIQTAPVSIKTATVPSPEPIKLNPIRWKVINKDGSVYFGLTTSDYSLLAGNMLELKRYIIAQKNIIAFYKQQAIQ